MDDENYTQNEETKTNNTGYENKEYVCVSCKKNLAQIIGAAIISASIIASSFMVSDSISKIQVNAPQGDTLQNQSDNQNIKVSEEGEPFIGSKDAKLVMFYWFDYQCPFCKKFDTETLPSLKEKYVDTGKVRIVFKDLQFLGEDSIDGGLVGHAVADLYPELYFEWHQKMFEYQDEENGGFGNMDSIFDMMKKEFPQVDLFKVQKYIEDNRDNVIAEMDEDKVKEAYVLGIRGTPGFLIGEEVVTGALPQGVFEATIEKQLNK